MIDLNKYKQTKKEFDFGLEKKYTFVINGDKYFFKLNTKHNKLNDEVDGEIDDEIGEILDFDDYWEDEKNSVSYNQALIEVIVSNLFEKVGLKNFVKYKLAEYDGEIGCLCKSYFEKETSTEIQMSDILVLNYLNQRDGFLHSIDTNYSDEICDESYEFYSVSKKCCVPFIDIHGQYTFSVDDILEEIIKFAKNYNFDFDEKQIKKGLEQIVVCDFFTCNNDRNLTNIGFLLNDKEKPFLKLTPIFDNGYSFGKSYVGKLRPYHDLPMFYMSLGFSDIGKYKLLENSLLEKGGIVAVDIYELAHKDADIAKLVNGFLKTDIEEIIDEIEKENGITINSNHRDFPNRFFSNRVNIYKKVSHKLDKIFLKDKEICKI